jgi:hypothetical protein
MARGPACYAEPLRLVAGQWPRLADNDGDDRLAVRLFVLTRAISGVLAAALREDAQLDRQALERRTGRIGQRV